MLNRNDAIFDIIFTDALTPSHLVALEVERPWRGEAREELDRVQQLVAIVFPTIALPAAAAAGLTGTHLVFIIDEVHTSHASSRSQQSVTLRIFGELSASAEQPSTTAYSLSARPRTTATIEWIPEPSTSSGELLISPDISPIVAEIISLPGWSSGNAMAILIEYVSGTGSRWVESYQISSAFAARSGSDGATPALEVYSSV